MTSQASAGRAARRRAGVAATFHGDPKTAGDEPAERAGAANERAFDAWLDDFFAHYYARRPVNATFIGVHAHDHELPDLSAAGRAQTVTEMRDLRARLASIPVGGLTEARRHDRRLADGFLEIQIWEDSAPQFHAGNPAFSTGEGVFAVMSLFLRDSEPLTARVAAATARMRALPAFLTRARETVRAAPPAWTRRAIREARAAVAYFGEGLPTLAAPNQIGAKDFLAAAETARDAFVAHFRWLEEDLLAHPADDYACGRQALDRYLTAGHCLPPDQDAAWIAAHAARVLARERDALERGARERHPNRTWRSQLADLADHHPTPATYYASFGQTWEAARQAAIAHDLVTWPDAPIAYGPVPPSDRAAATGLYYLPYRCPAPFGRTEVHRYLVSPIEPDMPEPEQARRLREMNDCAIKLNHVVHHGGLGHHVQNWHARRSASRIGQVAGVDCAARIALFCAGTLVEGWACYATDLMDEIGFLTPLESFAQHHAQLRMAARALVDVSLHTGAMTLAEAAAFYEGEVGMPTAAAEAEAVKNSMFPGAALIYLVGTDAIHDLRRAVATREGAAFSRRAFHDRFLGYGAVPVALIRRSMLGEDVTGAEGDMRER